MIPKVPLLNQSFFLFFSSQQIHLQPEITTFILFSNRCQVALSPLPSAILRNITVHFSTVTLQHTRELATLQGANLPAIFHFSQLNLALFFCFLKTSCFFGLLRLSASIEIAVENCFSLIPTAVVFTPCWGIQGLQKRMKKNGEKMEKQQIITKAATDGFSFRHKKKLLAVRWWWFQIVQRIVGNMTMISR